MRNWKGIDVKIYSCQHCDFKSLTDSDVKCPSCEGPVPTWEDFYKDEKEIVEEDQTLRE